MKVRHNSARLLFVVLLQSIYAVFASAQDPNQVISSGSGFLIGGNGELLTNAHVIHGCSAVRVKTAEGRESATVMVEDETNDIALLRTSKPIGTKPLTFREERRIKLGEPVIALGYPLQGLLASSVSATTGSVSSLAGPSDDNRFLQFTAPIQPGNSGGLSLTRLVT